MGLGRVAIAGSASVALAAVLGGCVVFTAPPTVKQVGKKPKVAVKFEICLSSFNPGSDCADFGNSNDVFPGDYRLLLGFRVPKGTKAPQSFQPKQVTVTAGAAEEELEVQGPARCGRLSSQRRAARVRPNRLRR